MITTEPAPPRRLTFAQEIPIWTPAANLLPSLSLSDPRARTILNLNLNLNHHPQGDSPTMTTAIANPPEAAEQAAHPDHSTLTSTNPASTNPASTKSSRPTKSTAPAAATQVSLSLDPDTYAWFEAKAKEDDRTVSRYIARFLRSYIQSKTRPAAGEKPGEEF